MRIATKFAAAGIAVAAACIAAPGSAAADTIIRDSTAADLYISSETPTGAEFERQAAALWNPNISIDDKLEASYHGESVREAVESAMAFNAVYNFLAAQVRAEGSPVVNGDNATQDLGVVLAGFPTGAGTYVYVYDEGLWKMDWKATCDGLGGCTGDPDFGY